MAALLNPPKRPHCGWYCGWYCFKVGIVGAGNVGAAVANALVLLSKSVTVVLFDRNLSKAEGQAWDINDAIPLLEEMDVIPSNRYEDLADSDIIVVTVGTTPTPGRHARSPC